MLRPTGESTMTRKPSLAMIADCARPLANLVRGRPVLATFQVTLRCNSACGYCDLPLNQGRYELTREEIRGIFGLLYTEGIRFVLVQGVSRFCVRILSTSWRTCLRWDCM